MSRTRAFSLIELLAVLSVLSLLTGMLLPLLGVAKRSAQRTATQAVMGKTAAALRLYRGEMGTSPYEHAYADLDAGAAWSNRLYRLVGARIATADLQRVRADADAAAANYDYPLILNWNGTMNEPASFASIHTYRQADIIRGLREDMSSGSWSVYGPMGTAVLLNRLARERARLIVFAGNPWLTGLALPDQIDAARKPIPGSARSTLTGCTRLIATPQSAARAGWADDYLAGDLDAASRDGDAILDAWHRPLIYVCQVEQGVRPPRAPAVLGWTTKIDPAAYHLLTAGRTTVGPGALHSDRRTTAAPGQELEFELWSAGPDWGGGVDAR